MRLLSVLLLVLFNLLCAEIVYARSQFTLPESSEPLYSLSIKTSPQHATIKIMNIKLKYQQGMKLKAGNYRVNVSAAGYQLKQRIIPIRHKNIKIHIVLKKNEPDTESSDNLNKPSTLFAKTKGYKQFLRHANRLKGLSFIEEVEKFDKYCQRYANVAVRQAKRRVKLGCRTFIPFFKNDPASQWHLKKTPQKTWCKTVSAYATAKEMIYREKRLTACFEARQEAKAETQ